MANVQHVEKEGKFTCKTRFSGAEVVEDDDAHLFSKVEDLQHSIAVGVWQ